MSMKKKTYTDRELVLRLQGGKKEAFDAIYEKYYRLVYFIAYELCKNDADAKDISQETFVQIQKSIHHLQDPDRLKQWINRITINKCKNLFRKHIDLPVEEDVLFQNHVQEERFYMLPDHAVHFKSDQEMVQHFIQHLSYPSREVIVLCYYEYLSMSEIAEVLEIPIGTVKSRLRKAKKELKDKIDAYVAANDVPISFHLHDGILSAALLASYTASTSSLPKPIPQYPKHIGFSSLTAMPSHVLIASVVCIGAGSSYFAYQAFQEKQTATLPIHEANKMNDTLAKQYYFQLMDWACCREDMEEKNKEDFDDINKIYHALKSSSSPYYQRLVDEKWTSDFEELENLSQL